MFLSLMETNPGVLPALGPRFALIAKEIERLEKMEELKVLRKSLNEPHHEKTNNVVSEVVQY